MNTYMNWRDALELVKLRMLEDSINWSEALREFMQLTGYTLRESVNIANTLQQYQDQSKEKGK